MSNTTVFEHIGGHPLIDLVNTELVQAKERVDLFVTGQDILDWLADTEIVSADEIKVGEDHSNLLNISVQFRSQMRSMLAGLVATRQVSSDSLSAINNALLLWCGQPLLQAIEGEKHHLQLGYRYSLKSSDDVLGVLGYTAARFVADTDFRRVKSCQNEACIRYFLDSSRNGSRRWCSMEGCGNRMKARAFYARQSQLT